MIYVLWTVIVLTEHERDVLLTFTYLHAALNYPPSESVLFENSSERTGGRESITQSSARTNDPGMRDLLLFPTGRIKEVELHSIASYFTSGRH